MLVSNHGKNSYNNKELTTSEPNLIHHISKMREDIPQVAHLVEIWIE